MRLAFAFSTLEAGVGVRPGTCSVASRQTVINSVLYPGFGSRWGVKSFGHSTTQQLLLWLKASA